MSNVIRGAFKDPTTKANFVDKMMSRDFDGDLRSLAVDGDLKYERVRPHVLRLKFGHSGAEFEMVIRKPRSPEALEAMRAKKGKKANSRAHGRKRGERVGIKPPEGEQHQQTGTG